MDTENRIVIRAPWSQVFDAAAQVEAWPEFLPHYRWVKTGPWQGREREVRMSASRDGFPCWWTAQQRLERAKKRIHYRHTHSVFTRGMDVWWLLEALGPRETAVRLTHAMPPERPPLSWFRQSVVGAFFVHAIAQKTLDGVQRHLEEQA